MLTAKKVCNFKLIVDIKQVFAWHNIELRHQVENSNQLIQKKINYKMLADEMLREFQKIIWKDKHEFNVNILFVYFKI